ncbi:sigma-70 family RNA polymerase sigma factor [Streptomyces sp. NPDC091215]|uniref:sigma-70 family RNA polymerase sigma factor n=1 Tax=Streptomyces sp. NPDC091215 TaxID=3155192 RepID=UPI003416771B
MAEQPGAATVAAARDGDQKALDQLIAGYLPLVYNIVGRALNGHPDVDDVVQETMLRVVNGLGSLQDPASFRSWLVAVAMNRVRDQGRARQAGPVPHAIDETLEAADPGADFVDLTILRLALSGQRREVAEATRWLDADDRELLALWWLEAADQLSRAELAAALGVSTKNAAVRVQRLKAQLETARAVVRALGARPRCPELAALADGWDGQPSPLWRKRFARHARDCVRCARHFDGLVPAEALLSGTAMVPPPHHFVAPSPVAAGHPAAVSHSSRAVRRAAQAVGRRTVLKAALIGTGAVGTTGAVAAAWQSSGGSAAGLARASRSPLSTPSVSPTADPTPSPSATPSPHVSPHVPPSSPPSSTPTRFAHPGMLHGQADLERMAAKVRAGAQPHLAGWNKLVANPHSQSTWKPNPLTVVYRGEGHPENYGTLYNDIHAAYQNALRWKITAQKAHGDTARNILNAWSATLTKVDGSADRFLAAGIYGYQFANAAELMRGYPGFDLERFKTMMLRIFYPMNDAFLTRHNDAVVTNYWASWDLCNMASALAIGILCDDHAKVGRALDYFKHGAGNGSIGNATSVEHPGGLVQWQEVGRDQGHATLGIGLLGIFCETAWQQGVDLYGYDGNRVMKTSEYVARYNVGKEVPYTRYTWNYGQPGVWSGTQTFTSASPDGRGDVRPIWELLLNHYARRKGLAVPDIAATVRPEGGGSDYGPNSGGFDQLGFGTLAFTR